MITKRKLLPFAVSVASLSMVGQGALAEDVSGGYALEEIIVTAQKREQSLQDVPSSVKAITTGDLDRSNTSDFADLGKLTSGVAVNADSSGFFPTVRIRGVGSNRFSPGVSPSVTVFTNDIPMIRVESAFNNMVDISRVEILKGPQSTLFGKSVSSGAFSIYTNPPQYDSIEGFVEVNLDEDNLQEYRGAINLPITEGVALRAVGYTTSNEGDLKNLATGDVEESDNEGYRMELLIEPGENFSAILGYEKHKKDIDDQVFDFSDYGILAVRAAQAEGVQLPDTDPFDNVTYVKNPGSVDSETEILSLRTSWDVSDSVKLSYVGSYQQFESLADISHGGAMDSFLALSGSDVEAKTHEFRVTYEADNWSSVMGVFYSDSDRKATNDLAIASGYQPGNPFFAATDGYAYLARENNGFENVIDRAIFTHNIYHFNDSLNLTFGVRYQETEKTYRDGALYGAGEFANLHAPTFNVSTFDVPEQENTWESVTGSLKLSYKPEANFEPEGSDITYYGGYDRGFKAGGFNSVTPTFAVSDNPFFGNPPGSGPADAFTVRPAFDSQVADNFEIGVKSELMDRRLRLNASLFYQIYSDFQANAFDSTTQSNFVLNAAEVVSKGAEFEFAWLASESLMIDGSISIVDASWKEFENAPCNAQQLAALPNAFLARSCQQDLGGEDFHGNNEYSANLNATWSGELENGIEWFVRGELAYKDDSIGLVDQDARAITDDYTLVNASLGLSTTAWDITLWAKNLTDEEYTTMFAYGRDGDPASPGSYGMTHTPTEARTFGVKAKYNF